MRIPGTRVVSAVAVAACASLGLLVPAASAATYPPGEGTFSGDAQGWQVQDAKCGLFGTVEIGALCTAEGGYMPDAGNEPGSLGLQVTVVVNAITGFISAAIFESPEFTPAASMTTTFSLDRQFDPEGLFALEPTATYKATLVDKTGGGEVVLKEESLGDDATAFTRQTAVADVQAGHTYLIRIDAGITSQLKLAILSGGGSLRFDNVALRGVTPGNPDNPGGPGGSGGGADPGSGGQGLGGGRGGADNASSALTDRRLLALLRSSGAVGNAVRKGNRVLLRVKCPAKVGRSCRIVAQGMLNRNRAATDKRAIRVGKGKVRQVSLRVRPKLRARVAKRKSLLVRQTVKAGKATATFTKRRALVHR